MAETYDSILFICPKVAVYQVPPLTGKGFKTDSWGPLAQPIFSGRLRVIQTFSTADTSSTCEIRIEDPQTGELFAAAPYIGEHAVERAQDSTRYYQVRVVHEKRVAYLGLGFEERETSFDFQVALADYLKHARAGKELLRKSEPVKDYSLKDGQSINISLGVRSTYHLDTATTDSQLARTSEGSRE